MLINKRNKFLYISAFILMLGLSTGFILHQLEKKNILPAILKTRYHKPPKRTPDTFKEDFGPTASKSELVFHGDSAFTFKYMKSETKEHAFAGLFFPLENVDVNFSHYDLIEIGIKSHLARRVPLNLSVQNRIFTHQYVRHFIELKEGKHNYQLLLEDFFTPSSWYEANQISQAEIPEQDFSQVEALSLESCHLLASGVNDEFTVTHLTLKKDLTLAYLLTLIFCISGIYLTYRIVFVSSSSASSYTGVADSQKEGINDPLMLYINTHFTSPELSIDTLEAHFKQQASQLKLIIQDCTGTTFDSYLNYLRIEEAKILLQAGKHDTVADVAQAVGFKSPSNFNRLFKSQVGVSPKSYIELQGH